MAETYNLVSFSRAGDIFHYRWAARRCLKLLDFNSTLECITIEGSQEKISGEYIIDVAEYSIFKDNIKTVDYYQLKHSTAQLDKAFTLSLLKDTIVGFAKRYNALLNKEHEFQSVRFSIITNRPISPRFKESIRKLSIGNNIDGRFRKAIESYTKLKGTELETFCAVLDLVDGEGNYDSQKYEIHKELAEITSSEVDSAQVNNLVSLVQEKVVTPENNKILREDILKLFGVTSEDELFPAPPAFEKLEGYVNREQHDDLYTAIINTNTPIIISAGGGVGKSIVCCQLANNFSNGSLAITYDCFGNGKYRKLSEKRHRHSDALVQISNELARKGLCEPLIRQVNDQDDRLMRSFLSRLKIASVSLKAGNRKAVLVIMIDAADNAEMAAEEFGDTCFASQLLKEDMPDDCRLVLFSRPERTYLLKPKSSVVMLELKSFSDKETLEYLRTQFPDATISDGTEFKRLTDGNPRVQANALSVERGSVASVLSSLGPLGTTVDELIELQLEKAVTRVKESLPDNYQEQIHAICMGLANLPPFIPLYILSKAAGVEVEKVRSFVADLGRPLWLTDESIQFRDEPTETWFRNNFSANTEQVSDYIAQLKPLATEFPYVAEVLPSLLLRAERYDELIELALSDELLPEDSPIDSRSIRVCRLQFAFKAGLKLKKYSDAAKLAFRAGEEVAGDTRQLQLLYENIDLISPLQSNERVQELSHRRLIRGGWEGSENIYSASLLSALDDCKGEARGYLRAGENWLQLYFNERKKYEENQYHQDKLIQQDILEMANTHLNLFGEENAVNFILGWNPPETIFQVAKLFAKRLVDRAGFASIERVLIIGMANPSLVIAFSDELMSVGAVPKRKVLSRCLNIIINKKTGINKPNPPYEATSSVDSILSFLEACTIQKLPSKKIRRALNLYIDEPSMYSVKSDFNDGERTVFMRSISIKAAISGDFDPAVESLFPKTWRKDKNDYKNEQEIKDCKEIIGILLPWYMVKARIISGENLILSKSHEKAKIKSSKASAHRYREYDSLPYEISDLKFKNLILLDKFDEVENCRFLTELSGEKLKFRFDDRINALRASYRIDNLRNVRDQLEQSCYEIAMLTSDGGPEENASWFIQIARAVLPVNPEDASAYFDHAIEAVSKFGDELVERWEAVVSVAQSSAELGTPELAYRFMRCAELVGDTVAREKYFNRNEAVETCLSLSPESAFAILSRWKDRHIGWAERQLTAIAYESVRSDLVSPSAGWSLSAFSWDWEDSLKNFAFLCIDKEENHERRQYILDSLIRDFRIKGVSGDIWKEINKSSEEFCLKNLELNHLKELIEDEKSNQEYGERVNERSSDEGENKHDWSVLLKGGDLICTEGISEAISIFNNLEAPKDYDYFWKEVFNLISVESAGKFLVSLAEVENANIYDVEYAFRNFPESWKCKPSIKRLWKKSILLVTKRFVLELTNIYQREQFLNAIGKSEETLTAIKEGMLIGLSESCNLVSASTFYGFARVSVSLITPDQAYDLLDYSLSRFEEHIDPDYADGAWSDSLLPPSDMTKAFTGYIWSSLGSPRSCERWRAVHVVRRLYELGCQNEIDALLDWMQQRKVDSFGSKDYPFYELHARQYLLIALSRTVLDNPDLLKSYSKFFSAVAIGDESHVLIQKYSSDIALAIEAAYPYTYKKEIVDRMEKVLLSPFPINCIDKFQEFDTPWHVKSEVDETEDISFAHDFNRYWFNNLGEVFGVSSKQVEDLAQQVVLKDWGVELDGRYIQDPRQNLWKANPQDRETWHSHFEYPRTDDYQFYLSYHAMLSVASKLLHEMPVVHSREWKEDEWGDWLRRHTLTRNDGKWLSDRRDSIPLGRRSWIREEGDEAWRWGIIQEDFLEILFVERGGETWLNVAGSWNEYFNGKDEDFYIKTLLVPKWASQSLLNAIVSSEDPRDYKLVNYLESDFEHIKHPFQMKKWIYQNEAGKYLDEYDPFAGDVDYPPYMISKSIIDQFELVGDSECRSWHVSGSDKPSMHCQNWSEDHRNGRDEYIRRGHRMQAAFPFLLDLCKKTDSELIIEVQIQRRLTSSHYQKVTDDVGYCPPYNKIYLLSKDGKLRDTRKSYSIRKKTG